MVDSVLAWFVVDTSACLFAALFVGPRLAAKRVRVDAPAVMEEEIWPVMEPKMRTLLSARLAEERAGILADVRAMLVSAEEGGVRAHLQADVASVLQAAREEAAKGGFARGAVDPSDARAMREVREAERAEVSARIKGAVAEKVGPEVAEAFVKWAERAAPSEWKTAVKNPERSEGILGPLVRGFMARRATEAKAAAPAAGDAPPF